MTTPRFRPERQTRHPVPAGRRRLSGVALALELCLGVAAAAHASVEPRRDFADLSLEELANIQVTSVSKKQESLAEAPASIYVITGEDIRRSGATSLPEALRLAPNLQIARVDARNYAVTARGFNSAFENKLLVLIDGRTIYTPLFSGVFWDAQDAILEDIDRIEVISGPGATLWGANAVNGVINIITRSAKDTQGTLVSAGASRQERYGAVRYGGETRNGGYYRVYGKHAGHDDTRRDDGTGRSEGWSRDQAGFRADWEQGRDTLMLKGDAYDGALHQVGTDDIRIAGANLTGSLERKLDDDSSLRLLAYIDHTDRNQPGAFIEHLTTINLDAQRSMQVAGIHSVVWGAGYRLGLDRVTNRQAFAFLPGSLNLHWGNLFAEDEIALRDDLKLTAGLKLEHNNYTGTEYLPNIRLAWKPTPTQLLWSAASRSVRAPSRIDRDFFAPANPPVVAGEPQFFLAGGPDFQSEVANVLEVGYRAQPLAGLSYSVTAYVSDYQRLRTLEPNPAGAGSVFMNKAQGRTRGIEMWGHWQAAPSWRLSAGAVAQRVRVNFDPDSADSSASTGLASNDAGTYWMLRSSHNLAHSTELDMTLRHVGRLPQPEVPAYTALDLRLGWNVRPGLDLSLIGQNLLDPSHPEFGNALNRSEFERSVFLKLVWQI